MYDTQSCQKKRETRGLEIDMSGSCVVLKDGDRMLW